MRIAVLGAGAMGSLLGGYLSRAGHDVWLVGRRPEHLAAIREEGLHIATSEGVLLARPSVAASAEEVGPSELVVLATKAYHTAEAAWTARPLLAERTPVLTLQNGLGNVAILQQTLGPERILAGITAHGARFVAPGRIQHAGKGETFIGEPAGPVTPRLEEVARVFREAGFKVALTPDVEDMIWSKLVINAGINALGALAGFANGELLAHSGTSRLLEDTVNEGAAVARAAGRRLFYSDPVAEARTVAAATAENHSSMLQDFELGRRTEIEAINGALVRWGEELGVPTPVNRVLTLLAKSVEENYLS